MELNLERCRIKPYAHQVVGVQAVLDHVWFALFDEMGAGKTLQGIVAAQILYERGVIDKVLVLAPAAVRDVWFNQELGELKKHLWDGSHHKITEFHAKMRTWLFETNGWACDERYLQWMITNYEFIRSKQRLEQLLPFCGPKTLLILDESSAVKNHKAEQTKACLQLRRRCGRVLLFNGTPIANSPLDMYAQGNLMSPGILDCKTYFHFRSKYALIDASQGFSRIVGWQNLEDMQRRFAPHVLRRLKKDCLDLPEKLPPTQLTVALKPETWAIYREMRDEMVAWLSHSTVAIAAQAGVKAMRLAQICAGFIGGVQEAEPTDAFDLEPDDSDMESSRPSFIPRTIPGSVDRNPTDKSGPLDVKPTQEVGREVLDAYLAWVDDLLLQDPDLKLLTWCRFRPELQRTMKELVERRWKRTPRFGAIWGGQKKLEREAGVQLLDPRRSIDGPVIVLGTTATGSMGLNLAASHTVIYLTNDFSLKTRLQSEDRVHRPGQRNVVSYTDVVVTGPTGQKTVSHVVLKALRNKEDVANWTTRAWIAALTEE